MTARSLQYIAWDESIGRHRINISAGKGNVWTRQTTGPSR
ncbi:hypothetical protein HMPREF9303_2717 [Prevotella denticola CRIS 18C-A]|uniref:Uncharacterized protein n=1 Tax=Prevotella denticola CRIS 18C-A TaxID=944557 RepID=F0H965_9BACT|nr:hypothetical protein HMPREF9303_2717 [Prevotella denticola CRIS 18C-A]